MPTGGALNRLGEVATLAERIVDKLKLQARALDDDELAAYLGVVRQAVNQACRRLEREGVVERYVGPNNKIVNRLRVSHVREAGAAPPAPVAPRSDDGALLAEDDVKNAVKAYLEAQGYAVRVAWARARGIDIVATRPGSRLVLEAKGEAPLQPQQVNYFLGAIGELVQRMDNPDSTYGLAFPDNKQYRGLVSRLPSLARERLGLRVFFVSRSLGKLTVTEG